MTSIASGARPRVSAGLWFARLVAPDVLAVACQHSGMQDDRDRADDRSDEPESPYDLLQRGQALLARHHHAQAAIVLERADRVEPGRGSILEALGRAYYNSGQHELARVTFERLLELDPSGHYAQFALGQSLKRLGRGDEAGTHLRLAVALSPETPLYRDALARLGRAGQPPARRGDEPRDPAPP
jgi:Flp pilus assembly protein TadD